jgi:hypothetical protein
MRPLSAFAVFFSQSPSFLDSQVRMQKQLGRNNASSLFGVHEIPCDNQIRNLLDPVPPETVYPVMAEIGDALYQQGYLAGFRSINETLLIALDGTDFFSSEKISCGCCSETRPEERLGSLSPHGRDAGAGGAGPGERHPVAAGIRAAPGRPGQAGL